MNDKTDKGTTTSTRTHALADPHIAAQHRIDALDRAVRVSLANGGHEDTADTVKRATAFHEFLTKE